MLILLPPPKKILYKTNLPSIKISLNIPVTKSLRFHRQYIDKTLKLHIVPGT